MTPNETGVEAKTKDYEGDIRRSRTWLLMQDISSFSHCSSTLLHLRSKRSKMTTTCHMQFPLKTGAFINRGRYQGLWTRTRGQSRVPDLITFLWDNALEVEAAFYDGVMGLRVNYYALFKAVNHGTTTTTEPCLVRQGCCMRSPVKVGGGT